MEPSDSPTAFSSEKSGHIESAGLVEHPYDLALQSTLSAARHPGYRDTEGVGHLLHNGRGVYLQWK